MALFSEAGMGSHLLRGTILASLSQPGQLGNLGKICPCIDKECKKCYKLAILYNIDENSEGYLALLSLRWINN